MLCFFYDRSPATEWADESHSGSKGQGSVREPSAFKR
jgi:hypothetical protein